MPDKNLIGLSDLMVYVRDYVAKESRSVNWSKSISPQLRQLQDSNGEFFFLRGERVPTLPRATTSVAAAGGRIQGKDGAGESSMNSLRERRVQPKGFSSLDADELKELAGTRVQIRYRIPFDDVALSVRDELIRLKAKICEFEPIAEMQKPFKPGVVYYEKGLQLKAAKILVKLLGENGVYDWATAGMKYDCDLAINFLPPVEQVPPKN